MPRAQYIQTNFTAGALSPRLRGRTDLSRYANGAKRLHNCYPVIQGGAKRRPGTRFVAEVEDSASRTRLIPFVTRVGAAYVLEFGDEVMRIYKDGALIESAPSVPLTIATPYSDTELAGIDYCQDADTMFLAHQGHPIHRLLRFGDAIWRFGPAPFSTTPCDEIGARFAVAVTLGATGLGVTTATAGASTWLASDVGRAIIHGAGAALITNVVSGTVADIDVRSPFESATLPADEWILDSSPQTGCTPSAVGPVGDTINLVLTAAGWRTTDLSKFVRINGGLVRLTAYASTTTVSGVVEQELTGTSTAPALAWKLEDQVWNPHDGYPRTVTFHEQRLIAAGSPTLPQTVWGSRTGEPLDFTLLDSDSAAWAHTIASDETNQIAFVASAKHLVVMTYGGEFSMRGGVEKPITPTSVRAEPESNHGCAAVRPAMVARDTLFVQRSGRKVRSLGYRYDFDGYTAPDVSALAEHLLREGIVELAWQQEPDSLLWAVTGTGKLLTCTFDREQEVIGWADHDVGGVVESLCVIPTAESEQVWLVVRREIDGNELRYVERIDMVTDSPLESERYLLQTDCAIVLTDSGPQTVWTGLDHLEGETLAVVANGAVQPPVTVGAGEVEIERAVDNVQFGLPYLTIVELLTPEFGTGEGTIQGTAMSTSEVVLRLLETTGAQINGRTVPIRNLGPAVLDTPPPLFSGDVQLGQLGWDKGRSDITVTQELPMPFHLLAVVRTLTSNAG